MNLVLEGNAEREPRKPCEGGFILSILWIILIVVLVLALLGFFSRGAW
jgi:flagellar basal body-associated protein FliL